MNFQRILVPAICIAVVALRYRLAGWPGVAATVGGLGRWHQRHHGNVLNQQFATLES